MSSDPVGTQQTTTRGGVGVGENPVNSMAQCWAALASSLDRIGVEPAVAEHRIRLIESFIGLGLGTLARREIDRLGEGVDTTLLGDLEEQISRMADDRVTADERYTTLMGNLAQIELEVSPTQIEEWRSRAGETAWYRALDGNIVRSNESTNRFAHLEEVRSSHRRLLEPILEKMGKQCMAPIVLEGVDPPWMLQSFVDASPPIDHPTFRQRVLVVQSDWGELFDGLACIDLGDGLGDTRFKWFVGDDAPAQLLDWVDAQLDDAPSSMVIQCPLVRVKSSPDILGLMQEIDARWEQNAEELSSAIRQRPTRNRRWWADRYAQAEGGGVALRVFIPVSRHTTYLKYAAGDLAESFKARGCECLVLMESDDTSMISKCTYLRAIEQFDPDLIVSINSTRSGLGSEIPPDIPHVCWIQDSMAHLYDPKTGASFGEMDFIVGMVNSELIQKFGYPEDQTRWMPMVASRSKFTAKPIAEGFDTEIAWVTHQSEHPEVFRQRMIDEMTANAPDAAPKFVQLLDDVGRIVTTEPRTFLYYEMNRLVDEAFFSGGVPPTADALRSNMLHSMVIPYAERVFRHQTAQWAADIATRRGWRFRLYGNGWERHPSLKSFAAGPLVHGEELRACYRRSVVQLHASINQTSHQRVSECLLSGGLPLCRVGLDSFNLVKMQIIDRCFRQGIGEPLMFDPRDEPGWQVNINSDKETSKLIDDLRHLGLCDDAVYAAGWIGWNAQRVELAQATMNLKSERMNAEMFASMTDLFFADESTLESLVERAINAHAWRRDRISSANRTLPDEMTFDGFVKNVLDLIRARLNLEGG